MEDPGHALSEKRQYEDLWQAFLAQSPVEWWPPEFERPLQVYIVELNMWSSRTECIVHVQYYDWNNVAGNFNFPADVEVRSDAGQFLLHGRALEALHCNVIIVDEQKRVASPKEE